MMKTAILKVLLGMLLMLSSCVEEYHLPEARSTNSQPEIVIQGRILSGDKSVIYINHTQPLNSKEEAESVLNAQVSIIGQNGYQSERAEFDIENDCYTIDTRKLPNNTLYALKVEAEGETYQSDFQSILAPPEIDEISYKEREDGISIHVSTHDAPDASRFYMWSYEEDWEFHADINIQALRGIPLYNEKFYKFENSYDNPYYYCWQHNTSKNIYLYSTAELEENTVKEIELLHIPIDDIRISYIYSILVKQWVMNKETYDYYRTMELYTENTGGLFTPLPSEVLGNVSCTSSPEKKVRGYVLSAQITSKRIFIYESDFEHLVPEYQNCTITTPPVPPTYNWAVAWKQQMNYYGAAINTSDGNIDMNSTMYSSNCVDCRAVEGATKKRPDFWPNNHE